MTTEAVLLLGLFAFLLLGAFVGNNGPRAVFAQHGPKLAARIESELSTGRNFNTLNGGSNEWRKPDAGAPSGSF